MTLRVWIFTEVSGVEMEGNVTACDETFYGADMLIGLSGGGGGNRADLLVKDTFI
jgi:hypothetical protein